MYIPKFDIDRLFFDECGEQFDCSYTFLKEAKTVDWYPNDTEERFKTHLKQYLNSDNEYIKNSLIHYQNHPFTYKVNREGFRDEPLETKPEEVDVFLGCSFTFGIGIRLEDTWPYKLGKYTNFPYINAGIGGSGVMTQYRVLLYLASKFKIRNVYYLIDYDHNRFEWFYDSLIDADFSGYRYTAPSCDRTEPGHYENVFNEKNRVFQLHAMTHAINGFCDSKGIKLYTCIQQEFSYFLGTLKVKDIILDKFKFDYTKNFCSRDVTHPPPLDHHAYYLYFLDMLGVNIYKEKYI